jgi:hypothetical protein
VLLCGISGRRFTPDYVERIARADGLRGRGASGSPGLPVAPLAIGTRIGQSP